MFSPLIISFHPGKHTMCGICGFQSNDHPIADQETLGRMVQSLGHRGPDGQNSWISPDGGCGLGHTRLSIIDIAGGTQPMVSLDRRFSLVFNGEIYNYKALTAELKGLGHDFQTRSDTEVILNGFKQWGTEVFNRLNGMFGLALFDQQNKKLFLARDRVGIKPVYFHCSGSSVVFGSEIKAILACPAVPRHLDSTALQDYLVLGYPVLPNTFFRDIQELKPGTWISFSPEGMHQETFWQWHRKEEDISFEMISEEAGTALTESLRSHMESDVPVGAFLSGGVDSSLIVAGLVRNLGTKIDTFTVRFGEAAYDESPYAAAVAKHLDVPHHILTIDNSSADLDFTHTLMEQFDQPFIDTSAIPTSLICREIRKHVKVALSGDGGDEMFGGYPRFFYTDVAATLGRLPHPSISLLRLFIRGLARFRPALARQLDRIAQAANHQRGDRLLDLVSYNYQNTLSDILTPEYQSVIRPLDEVMDTFVPAGTHAAGPQMIDSTVAYALPGDYLRKVDFMSSMHGLEVRVPLLGNDILDFATRIPARHKYHRLNNKLILKNLLKEFLPEELVNRKKAGFGIPIDSWLGAAGRQEVARLLSAPDARYHQLIKPSFSRPLVKAFIDGKWDQSKRSRFMIYQNTFMLWSLERWLQHWQAEI